MLVKPLGDELDFPITWALAAGETIASAAHSIYPVETGGLAVKAGSATINGAVTSYLAELGVFGHLYEATTAIVTSQGRKLSRTVTVIMGVSEAVQ